MKEKASKPNWKVHLIIGIIVSILLVLLIAKQIDLGSLKQVFMEMNLLWMIPFLGCVVIYLWLKAERWKLFLQPLRTTSLKEVMPSMIIGISVNFLLFSYLGELVRTYLLHRETNIPKTSIFGTIILERILDVVFVLMLASIGFSFSQSLPQEYVVSGYVLTFISLCALACVITLVFFTDASIKVLTLFFRFVPARLRKNFFSHLEQGVRGLHSLANSKLLFYILITSVVQWLLMSLCVYLTLVAANVQVPFYASFITVAAMAFAIIFPSSPGHVGVIELCFILSLEIFGVAHEQALAAGLMFHFLLYTSVIIAGLWYLNHIGISLSKVKQQAEDIKIL